MDLSQPAQEELLYSFIQTKMPMRLNLPIHFTQLRPWKLDVLERFFEMTVDLTPVVQAIMSLMGVAVATAVSILVPALLKRWKIANDSDLGQRVQTAADAAAGVAYNYAMSRIQEGGLARVSVQDAAIGKGLEHVVASVPGALAELGIDDAHVKAMVSARLGTLLATDPSATAGAPSVASPVDLPATVVVNTAPPPSPETPAPQVEVTVNPPSPLPPPPPPTPEPEIRATMTPVVTPTLDLGPYKISAPRMPSFPFLSTKKAPEEPKTEPPKVDPALNHP